LSGGANGFIQKLAFIAILKFLAQCFSVRYLFIFPLREATPNYGEPKGAIVGRWALPGHCADLAWESWGRNARFVRFETLEEEEWDNTEEAGRPASSVAKAEADQKKGYCWDGCN
jgi:hypothetical protein